MAKSRSAIHVVIFPIHTNAWILSVVYNPLGTQGQRLIWKELSGMNYLNIPWIIIGDFNAVVDLNKHKGGSHYYYVRKARIFSFY